MKTALLTLLMSVAIALTLSAQAAPQDEQVYEAGPDVTLPKATKIVHAQYTPDAMKDRIQDEVILRCVVSREGRPTRIEVVNSLDERLDAVAVKALEQWEFDPGKSTKDGQAVAVRISVEMNFTLK